MFEVVEEAAGVGGIALLVDFTRVQLGQGLAWVLPVDLGRLRNGQLGYRYLGYEATYGGFDISLPRELEHRVGDAILIGLVVGRCWGRDILVGLCENAVREELVLFEVLQRISADSSREEASRLQIRQSSSGAPLDRG